MRRRALVAALVLALAPAIAASETQTDPLYVNHAYDWRANPYQDLERAMRRATAENKRILIVVGGDWCVWCDVLDLHLARNASVRAAFAESFVILKVNWSRQNENVAFLSGFPPARGYPDFLILGANGAYLGHQPTDALEDGRDYDPARMISFAQTWRVRS